MRRGNGRRGQRPDHPAVTLGFDEIGQVLSPDGRIKSFSSDADGYTRSEGGAMLVLKRVDDARRDGDQILAVIAGSAVNHDGRSNGLIAPNPDAQADVLRRAYKDAGINPRTIDFVEAHGTGTVLGDPIEAQALGRVAGRGRPADKPLLLGAIKTNVGHMESAAGAASLSKMVLSLQHGKLPPSINYAGPNPYIDFDASHLKVLTTVSDWPRYSGYAIAGVSELRVRWGQRTRGAFERCCPAMSSSANPSRKFKRALPPPLRPPPKSTSSWLAACNSTSTASSWILPKASPRSPTTNTNCPASPTKPCGSKRSRWKSSAAEELPIPVVPLSVSAFLTSRKRAAAAELADWLESPEGQASSLESIGRALSRRNHGRSRAVVLAHDHDEAIKGLRAIADGKQKPYVFSTDGPATNGPVWAMAGFGAQHRKMGKNLYLRNDDLRRVDRQGRRADPGRAGLLGARADPRRLGGLRHRNQQRRHLRDPDRVG